MRTIHRRCGARSGQAFEERADLENTYAAAFTARTRRLTAEARAQKLARQRVVVGLQSLTNGGMVRGREPQAEARPEVVVAGRRVVESVTLGSMTHEPRRDAPAVLGVTLGNHRLAMRLPKGAGQGEALDGRFGGGRFGGGRFGGGRFSGGRLCGWRVRDVPTGACVGAIRVRDVPAGG